MFTFDTSSYFEIEFYIKMVVLLLPASPAYEESAEVIGP